MKYAYRLLKDTRTKKFELHDVIFPVSDDLANGLHKDNSRIGVADYMYVFEKKEQAELSLKYERYAESCKKLTDKEKINLMNWEIKRITKYVPVNHFFDEFGIKITAPNRHTRRIPNSGYVPPAERYLARAHAIADRIEEHFRQIRTEIPLIVPTDRPPKETKTE